MIDKAKKKTESVRAEIQVDKKAKSSKEKITSAHNAKPVEAEKDTEKKHERP